jgi:hypothetical protein
MAGGIFTGRPGGKILRIFLSWLSELRAKTSAWPTTECLAWRSIMAGRGRPALYRLRMDPHDNDNLKNQYYGTSHGLRGVAICTLSSFI